MTAEGQLGFIFAYFKSIYFRLLCFLSQCGFLHQSSFMLTSLFVCPDVPYVGGLFCFTIKACLRVRAASCMILFILPLLLLSSCSSASSRLTSAVFLPHCSDSEARPCLKTQYAVFTVCLTAYQEVSGLKPNAL